jgi:MFS superfamily sulfate permease-like transporter
MVRIYRRGGWEISIVAASAALVVALPIETGMLLAIALSFVTAEWNRSSTRFQDAKRAPDGGNGSTSRSLFQFESKSVWPSSSHMAIGRGTAG